MTKRSKQLAELGRVTEASLTAAQGRMRKIQGQEQKLLEQRAQLNERKTLSNDEMTLMRQAGADVRWQRWSDQRRDQINQELARVYINKESARQALRLAFGKDLALQLLMQREKAKEKQNFSRQLS